VVLKLLAFVLPLGVESFATAAALGTRRQRWRLSLLFVAFEGGMPLIGLAIGAPQQRWGRPPTTSPVVSWSGRPGGNGLSGWPESCSPHWVCFS
jgi:hypothetical protein